MKRYVFLLLQLIGFLSIAQTDVEKSDFYENYREDQFYASITYNLLNEKPNNVSQSGFSSGFHLGFIRDMPINTRRNVAIGLGLGLSVNSYHQKNLFIEEINNTARFSIIDEDDYNVSKNKFNTYVIEVPIEFRWRTSTTSNYDFWRIYSGFKMGYLLYSVTKFNSNIQDEKLYNSDSFNKLQYGLTLSVGYGRWNFHVFYGLNPIFESNYKLKGETINMKPVKIGLMFYIL
ncbi:porin family protein [Winogradskyella bathintestinalis]|uniref:Porin family protein n=1 Tax=Winogradskyella bathintestinalis TaxID=3035208 RepID=A0ABT7ZSJ3_9FLAO|nr:porin family protein [Winogradskyella bathintestinalis]MDN3491960.1 porin family protein [Winogradskyella bathintestinalis]